MKDSKEPSAEMPKELFVRYVKERLAGEYTRMAEKYSRKYNQTFSINKLIEELEDYSWVKVVRDRVKRTFDVNDELLDLNVIIGICQLYHYDYAYFLPPIAESASPLVDPGYMQQYYGYMYSRNTHKEEPLSFSLKMENRTGEPVAVLTYEIRHMQEAGKTMTYFGTPVLTENRELAYILFANGEHSFYHFYFHYRQYSLPELRFRKGFAVSTVSDEGKHEVPLLMNFVMFHQPVSPERFARLESILRLDDGSFVVPEEDYTRVIARYSHAAHYFAVEASPYSPIRQEAVCVMDEPTILRAIENDVRLKRLSRQEREEAFSCLMELKAQSHSPKRITYENRYYPFVQEAGEEAGTP